MSALELTLQERVAFAETCERLMGEGLFLPGKKPGTVRLSAKGRRRVEDMQRTEEGRKEEAARVEAVLRGLVAEADAAHDAHVAIWAEEVLRRLGYPT